MTVGGKEIKDLFMRELGATDTTSEAYISDAILRNCPVIPIMTSLDANSAGNVLAEQPCARVPYACKLVAAHWTNGIAVTANDTNYKTLLVQKRTAGGAATTIASITTKITGGSGNITAFVPVALTLGSDVSLAAGDIITVSVTKAAGGVALGAALYAIGNVAAISLYVEKVYAAS